MTLAGCSNCSTKSLVRQKEFGSHFFKHEIYKPLFLRPMLHELVVSIAEIVNNCANEKAMLKNRQAELSCNEEPDTLPT